MCVCFYLLKDAPNMNLQKQIHVQNPVNLSRSSVTISPAMSPNLLSTACSNSNHNSFTSTVSNKNQQQQQQQQKQQSSIPSSNRSSSDNSDDIILIEVIPNNPLSTEPGFPPD